MEERDGTLAGGGPRVRQATGTATELKSRWKPDVVVPHASRHPRTPSTIREARGAWSGCRLRAVNEPAANGAENPFELEPERVAELHQAGEAELIDVRQDYEHAAGRIANTRHIEINSLTSQAESIPRDRTVVFYCRSGSRSGMAAEAFAQAGWDAHNLAGGLIAWVERGLPIEPSGGEVAAQRPV